MIVVVRSEFATARRLERREEGGRCECTVLPANEEEDLWGGIEGCSEGSPEEVPEEIPEGGPEGSAGGPGAPGDAGGVCWDAAPCALGLRSVSCTGAGVVMFDDRTSSALPA